jgi:hypothetical protein
MTKRSHLKKAAFRVMHIDPDCWIAEGHNLLNWRLPAADDWPLYEQFFADPARADLAAHIGRWLLRIAELGPTDKRVGDVLTEKVLRETWEETRAE